MGFHVVIAAGVLAASAAVMPGWDRRPDAEAVSDAYPGLAAFLKIEGRASLACSLTDTGATRNCEVTWERPAGLGFGQAALLLAKDFQMRPLMVSGIPIDGGAVQIPLAFKTPAADPAPPEAPRPKVSQRALELARGVIAQISAATVAKPDLAKAIKSLELSDTQIVDPTLRAYAAKAYEDAYQDTLPEALERLARQKAEDLSEAELQLFAQLFALPDAKSALTRIAASLPDPVASDDELMDLVRDRAHIRFCAQFDCNAVGRAPAKP